MGSGYPKLSVVIPAYNEQNRIRHSLKDALEYLTPQKYSWEILVVDDGSNDRTVEVAQALAQEHSEIIVLKHGENQGKGAAVRTGVLGAKGNFVVFTDADGSTSLSEMDKFWPLFDKGADVVIGSRSHKESNIVVHQPWYREKMGRIFNLLVRLMGLSQFKDTQCGFKAFSRSSVETIFPRLRVKRFGFDVEILTISSVMGLTIREVPVSWVNSLEAKVNPVTDASRMFLDLVMIWARKKLGTYKQ